MNPATKSKAPPTIVVDPKWACSLFPHFTKDGAKACVAELVLLSYRKGQLPQQRAAAGRKD